MHANVVFASKLNVLTWFLFALYLQVKLGVLWTYIKAMGLYGAFPSILSMIAFQGLSIYGNFFLTFWTEDAVLKNQSLSDTKEYDDRNIYYLLVYTVLGILRGKLFFFLLILEIVELY